VATIDSSGLATSKGVGSCTITVTSQINGVSVSASATLRVVSLSIIPANITIPLGSVQQYQAKLSDDSGSSDDVTQSVTWSSDNTNVATIATTGDTRGLTTSRGEGTCTITADYIINGISISATAQLTVVLPTLSISPATSTILVGSTQQYQAKITDYIGNITHVTQSVTWSSDNTNVATIATTGDNRGLATSRGKGTCTITATYVINEEVSLRATATLIIVDPNNALALIVTPIPRRDAIFVGNNQQFSAYLEYSDGSMSADIYESVIWSSSPTSVATIVSPGLVHGNSAGTSLISATLNFNNTPLTGSYLLTVLLQGGIIREWEQ